MNEKNSAELYFSIYFIVVFRLGEVVLLKAEEKNWGIDSMNSRWDEKGTYFLVLWSMALSFTL